MTEPHQPQVPGPRPPQPPPWPPRKSGSRGEAVRVIQYLLREHRCGYELEVDGIFGRATADAVREFQAANDLDRDGVVGPRTWVALVTDVRRGSLGDAVRAVQRLLRVHRPGEPEHPVWKALEVDGIFGPLTQIGVWQAQSATAGLGPLDGAMNAMLWQWLVAQEGKP